MSMTYSKTAWANGIAPAINSTNLGNLENFNEAVAAAAGSGTRSAKGTLDADLLLGIPASQLVGFRNKIINGDMKVFQRVTITPATGDQYTVDRWILRQTTASATAITQVLAATLGTWTKAPAYALQVTGKASNTVMTLIQRIEAANAQAMAGQSVTFSIWVYTSDSRAVTLFADYANAADNFSGGVTSIVSTAQGSASGWRQHTLTFTAPANAVNGVQVGVAYGASLAGVTEAATLAQVEIGSVATDFEQRPIGVELMLCQRYYEKSFLLATAPAQAAGAGTGEYRFPATRVGAINQTMGVISFRAAKRSVSGTTVTSYSPISANNTVRDIIAGADCGALIVNTQSEVAMTVACTGNAATAVGNALSFHWTIDAEL